MKRFCMLLLLIIAMMSVSAQAPHAFSYQAIVRDSGNKLLINSTAGIRISILQGDESGTVVYEETHKIKTNANGLMTLQIGSGNAVKGMLESIDWANGPYYIKSEIDPSGGDSYSLSLEHQLLSVPYAQYANMSGNAFSGKYEDLTGKPEIPVVPTKVGAFENDAKYISNLDCPTVNICDMNSMLKDFNNRLDSLQNIISNQDSIMNALNKQVNPLFDCGNSIVKDHEGNIYHTVKLGEQCWLRENMRCKTSPGTGMYLLTSMTDSYSGKNAYYPHLDSTIVNTYGLLYNWNAAVDTFNTEFKENSGEISSDAAVSVSFLGNRRGICPKGWHVPSDAEWRKLTEYVNSRSEYWCISDKNLAKALASTTGWNYVSWECAVGNNQSDNNATGFSAYPAGFRGENFGMSANFWSATQSGKDLAQTLWISFSSKGVMHDQAYKCHNSSVRCLRDSGITGICANNERVNEDDNSYSDCCSELETQLELMQNKFNNRLESLQNIISAQDSIINLLNNQMNDLRPFECGSSSIKDHEGNIYNTVKIGKQCWTRENMRCKTSPSTGTSIVSLSYEIHSSTGKMAYYPNNDVSNVATYGMLYNWCAAVDTFNTAFGEISVNEESVNNVNVTFPSNRRGICPEGWHVPNDADWTQLSDYVGSQSEYVCDNDKISIGKSLASNTGWETFDMPCSIGYLQQYNNNKTGFTALPAGACCYKCDAFGVSTQFWSSTQNGKSSRGLFFIEPILNGDMYPEPFYGLSVRCLKD